MITHFPTLESFIHINLPAISEEDEDNSPLIDSLKNFQ